jgi:hypothetical protein
LLAVKPNSLRAANKGTLIAQPNKFDRGQELAQQFCIVRGCHMMRYGPDLLENNRLHIGGLLFDAIWRVLRPHVTVVLMAVIRNVAVPLAIEFSAIEDATLYQMIFDSFPEESGIQWNEFIIKSDQAAVLKIIHRETNTRHLTCLCYFQFH